MSVSLLFFLMIYWKYWYWEENHEISNSKKHWKKIQYQIAILMKSLIRNYYKIITLIDFLIFIHWSYFWSLFKVKKRIRFHYKLLSSSSSTLFHLIFGAQRFSLFRWRRTLVEVKGKYPACINHTGTFGYFQSYGIRINVKISSLHIF